MDWRLFASTFGLIFIAEVPDKTALAVLVMASRQNPRGVFTGAAAAFAIQSAMAIVFGSLFGLLPPGLVHRLAGALFWVFALVMVLKKEDAEGDAPVAGTRLFWKAAWAAFVVIFISEWGDLSQLATATLVAKTKAPLTIFFASVLSLWVVTGLSAALGHHARQKLKPERLRWAAAIVFALVGTFLFFRP